MRIHDDAAPSMDRHRRLCQLTMEFIAVAVAGLSLLTAAAAWVSR